MSQINTNTSQEEWLKILGKGMVTLPKKWRDEMGIEQGTLVKAKKLGNTITIEPKNDVSFDEVRTFSEKEIQQWIKEDELPEELAKKAEEYWENLP